MKKKNKRASKRRTVVHQIRSKVESRFNEWIKNQKEVLLYVQRTQNSSEMTLWFAEEKKEEEVDIA